MAYFSNSSDGSILDEQCGKCPVGSDPNAPCPVMFVQGQWNYKQHDKDGKRTTEVSKILNELVNDEGICLMRKTLLEARGDFHLLTTDQTKCPMCGCQDFNLEHQRPSSASREHWMKTCAACGHEFET